MEWHIPYHPTVSPLVCVLSVLRTLRSGCTVGVSLVPIGTDPGESAFHSLGHPSHHHVLRLLLPE